MLDFITIFNLMKQVPEFSMFGGAFFIYLFYYYVKNQGGKKIEDTVKSNLITHLEPIKTDLSQVNVRLGKIEQNICGK